MKTATPEAVNQMHRDGVPLRLIDVRTPAEFRAVHVPYAENVPLGRLKAAELGSPAGVPIYLMCRSGKRAQKACRKLEKAGLTDVAVIERGAQGWMAADLELIRGPEGMSLERQVRIAAGSLVFAGTVLGALVHPAWLVVPAFVGGGLVFAGITDTCGMGMLLAYMPWNRAGR